MIKSLKFIYLLLGFVSFSQTAKKSSGEIKYKIETIGEYFGKENKNPSPAFLKTTEAVKLFEYITFTLSFNEEEATFSQDESLNLDGKSFVSKTASNLANNDTYYYNISKDLIIDEKSFLGDIFLIKSKVSDINWELTNEKKQIGEYVCNKARISFEKFGDKREFTAWYTSDIPANFGPIGFCGLPGLILELHTNKLKYIVTDISFSSKPNKIKPSKNGINISLDEFEDYVDQKLKLFKKGKL